MIAVDASNAVDAAMANLGGTPNVHIVQADITRLPLKVGIVRHLYSIGVLQHTPDPIVTAQALVHQLPAGGKFCFTIYGRRPWTRLFAKYWCRPISTRVAPERLLDFIEKTMPVLFPVTSVLFVVPVLGRGFRFVIPVANYVDLKDVPRQLRYQEAILDTFDMLSPRYDQPITSQELCAGLAHSGARLSIRSRVPVIACGVRVS